MRVRASVSRWLAKSFDDLDERSGLASSWVLLAASSLVLVAILLRGAWAPLDILSPLGPHAFALAGIAAIALMLGRLRPFFLMSSLGLVAIVPSLMSLEPLQGKRDPRLPWQDRAASDVETPSELRVLAINTWHANTDLVRLADTIASADADVVVLSEFGPDKIGVLDAVRHAFPYQESCAQAWACSQALLSRVPFERAGTRMPTLRNPPMVWAEFHFGALAAAKVTVIGTHIYRPSRRMDWHLAQLKGLADHVRRTDGSVIVAGDFNMTRMSQSFDDFTHASGLVAPERVLASWPAWPLPLPQLQFDYLFTSRDLKVVDQRLGQSMGSDHLPLWSAVRLSGASAIMAGLASTRALH